jgi:hypothetical protein
MGADLCTLQKLRVRHPGAGWSDSLRAVKLSLNPAIWETIAATRWRRVGAGKNAGRVPALPLKTRRSGGHGAQRAAPLHIIVEMRLREGGAEAADDAVLAQGDHGVEEGWGDRLADDGNAGGVDEEAGFYAGGLGYGAACVVAGVVIPLG